MANVMKSENELNKQKRKNMRSIYVFLIKLLMLAVILVFTFGVVFGLTIIPNDDMKPRLSAGDIVLFYRHEQKLQNGDAVIYQKGGKSYAARIIGVAGDSIEITQSGALLVNGSQIVESSIYYQTYPFDNNVDYPLQLQTGEYFLMGDFRTGAKDSRYYGAIKENEVKGKIMAAIRRNNL